MEGGQEPIGFDLDPVQSRVEINPFITLCPNQLKSRAPALKLPPDRIVFLPRVHKFPTSKTEC